MTLKFSTDYVEDWKVNYLDFEFGKLVLKKVIRGKIINSITQHKIELLNWKQKIAENISKAKIIAEPKAYSIYAVSLSFRFHQKHHSSNKLDVENYIKPVIDGIAAGLFSKNPKSITKFNFDDSNFKHLLIEKLDSPLNPSDEGIAIVVTMAN